MKKIVLAAILFPTLLTAQVKSAAKSKETTKQVTPVTGGFIISGELTGVADGTKISLLNGQTGAPEMQTTVEKTMFSFKGKLPKPAFKIIAIDQKPPFLTLFLDNSSVKVSGDRATMDRAVVSGSASHVDFEKMNNALAPYQTLFGENAPREEATVNNAKQALQNFIQKNPSSYISPLAVVRYMQLAPDEVAKTEQLFKSLTKDVQATDIGNYVTQQLADGKVNAIGSELADFTQADTAGKSVSLSSLRGKYVLIDFWASWCRPCRQENPNVVASYNKFKDKNFTVLGISLDKAKPAWVEAIAQDNLTWAHVSDLQGWSNSVAQQFKIQSIPQNFLIGPDGKIIAKNLRGAALDQKLEQLLK